MLFVLPPIHRTNAADASESFGAAGFIEVKPDLRETCSVSTLVDRA
jgi:hypothetical protein